MVRNQSITSSVSASVSAAVSADFTESLQQTITGDKIRRFEGMIGLPTTLAGFLWFSLAIVLVCAGMGLLVLTSVQTYQTQRQITGLTQQLNNLEQQNAELVWQIAQHTAIEDVRQRASELGYDAPAIRHFVTLAPPIATTSTLPAPASTTNPALNEANPWQWLRDQINTIRNWW